MTRLKTLEREAVFAEINREREHQIAKYGQEKEQSLPGWLIILENELAEAKYAWTKGGVGRDSAMHEVLQIAATAVAALEAYGCVGCPRATNDMPDPDYLLKSRP